MTVPRRGPDAPVPQREEEPDWNSDALTRAIPYAAALSAKPPRLPVPALATPPVLATPPAPVPASVAALAPVASPRASLVRRASYALVPMLLALVALSFYRRQAPDSPPAAPVPQPSAAKVELAVNVARSTTRPVIETRTVDAPTAKQAAAAFARGDYREALAQYRALARLKPDEVAYRSLIGILERRLASKSSE